MIRNLPFILFLVLGAVGAIVMLILGQPGLAVAAGIASVGACVGYGYYTAWLFGIRRHVVRLMGSRFQIGEVLRHMVRTADRPNIQLALDLLHSRSGMQGPFGTPVAAGMDDDVGQALAQQYFADIVGLIAGNSYPTAIVWDPHPTSTEETLNCACNALYLLRILDRPVCVLVLQRAKGASRRAVLQILGRNEPDARAALNEILRIGREQSVYRGQVLSVQRIKNQENDLAVQFHDMSEAGREEIVLPPELQETIDRNILEFFRHAEALRRAGQGTRHGVLLHGPPGTGKTLVTRYLATNVSATVLLVHGRQYALLRPTCQLAKLLAPSLVILEDVDLIGADRRNNRHGALLHDLLDEMDGLGAGSDIVFLLTTNRPEILEPALASRPGRVDQAIYFPLPDLECRRRLFAQFRRGLDVSGLDLEAMLARTDGASPAFLKELFRRAVLLALERGAAGEPLPVTGEDFERSLRELLQAGGTLTRNFLGFPASPGT